MDIPTEVRSALDPHYNQPSSPGVEAAPVSKDGYKIISSLTLYIPERIDIDRILARQPPTFAYHRDYFVYILHLITSIPSRKRDIIDLNNGFTPINRKTLQKRIHGYKQYIEYLKAVGIVQESRHYIPNKISMGLKISPDYESRLIPITIIKWPLIKSIVYLHVKHNEELTEELYYLKHWLNNNLEVDYEGAVEYLDELYQQEVNDPDVSHEMLRYNSRLLSMVKLKNQEFSFFVDKTGNRLHTNITQMMSGLRKFIKYDGAKLCAIDIKNSQLYLAIALLDDELFIMNNIHSKITNPILQSDTNFPNMVVEIIRDIKNKPDVLVYKEWVASGLFYEKFGSELVESGIIDNLPNAELRTVAKETAFSSIYSPNTSLAYNPAIQLFKSLFPNVFEIFKLIKKGHKKHPALAICLQRLEAELVLHKACKLISEQRPDVFITTLHDSIITTEDNVEYVQSVLYNVLRTNISIPPNLNIERWE